MRRAPGTGLPLVTVAVCTRDRPEALGRCLSALLCLAYPSLDLLVIDNAPRGPETRNQVLARPPIRYTVEPRPGLDWARNRAIAEAQGEFLAFTDDDVLPDRHWVMALMEVFFEAPEVQAVTGSVVPHTLETPAESAFEAYGGFGKGPLPRRFAYAAENRLRRSSHFSVGQMGTGANMAFRRCLFAEIGGFDPALDVGTPIGGGGDLEMFLRVLQAGHVLVYEPKALVRHGHRRDMEGLRHQIRSWGRSFVSVLFKAWQAYPRERPYILLFGCRWLFGRYPLRLIREAPEGRCSAVQRGLVWEEFRGALEALAAYPRARRQARALEEGHRGRR